MFVDASAFCAILIDESDAESFSRKRRDAKSRITSSLANWETAVNVSQALGIKLDDVPEDIERFLTEFKIVVVAIDPDPHKLALEAYHRFGKGRHAAALNFGDCFAYACARHHKMPL